MKRFCAAKICENDDFMKTTAENINITSNICVCVGVCVWRGEGKKNTAIPIK